MRRRPGFISLLAIGSTGVLVAGLALATSRTAAAETRTTAWRGGTFVVDTPNLVRRSDVVLGRPNAEPKQFMPLGNGTLGHRRVGRERLHRPVEPARHVP